MATKKVGLYRKYHGVIPTDESGRPLPKSQWPKKRAHSWVVRWFGEEGNRYARSFRARKEAEWFAETKQSEVRVAADNPPPSIRIGDFVEEHEKVMPGQVARRTLVSQLCALRLFMEHVGRNVHLWDIKPRHAESFVAARLAKGRKVATVNKEIRTLKAIFNLAIDPRGYLLPGQNPFARIRQRRLAPKPLRYVTPQEFHRVLSAAPTLWWKALLSVAYTVGARLGEMLHLTWADVDFLENRIRIVSKGNEGAQCEWEPKDHEGRLLPVPGDVIKLLTQLQAEAAEGCPYVFVPRWRWDYIQRARKAKRWDDRRSLVNNLGRRLATLRKAAGVAKFTYHDLRRSCFTNWARHLAIHIVKKLAGHSDIQTTQQYYLSVQEDDLEKARQVQSEILGGVLTDPLLTHFGPLLGSRPEPKAS